MGWYHTIQASHYIDVTMGAIASQVSSLTIVYSIVYWDADQRKHQGSASLAFVRGIHRGPVNSPHKWPVTRKMFPFDDAIMFKVDNFTWKSHPSLTVYIYNIYIYIYIWRVTIENGERIDTKLGGGWCHWCRDANKTLSCESVRFHGFLGDSVLTCMNVAL